MLSNEASQAPMMSMRESEREPQSIRQCDQPLPDYLLPGLRALFVGINPGLRSAAVGHHFAGRGNRFWKLLADAELIPEQISYTEDWRLLQWGFGLTNLVTRVTRSIQDLTRQDFQSGRARLLELVDQSRPGVIVLVGVSLHAAVFPSARSSKGASWRCDRWGRCEHRLAGTPVFVLPNPSGRNAHYPYDDMLSAYRALRRYLDEHLPPHDACLQLDFLRSANILRIVDHG
ncbi:MAG: mismatch-specific DNA-glycosylase [Nitrospirae bacterium]|nr:MAG: mismatch-specific DNA-glycosylase [Nitrospirota bacterium]